MTRLIKTLLIALALFGLAACTSKPLLQPQVALPPDREFSQVEMQQAIVAALEARHWRVGRIDTGRINAAISVRKRHHAAIVVEYTPFDFAIHYRNSQGLEYEDGEIHRNYNRWVNSLRAEILHQLKLPKTL